MKRRILIALAVVIPLALFFVARNAGSKRPLIVGQHAGAASLQFSPDGKRMLSYGKSEVSSWDLQERNRKATWKMGLSYVFSPDSESLAAIGNRYDNIDATHARTVISGVVCDVATGQARIKFSDIFKHPPFYQDNTGTLTWSADSHEIWVLSSFYLRRFDAHSGKLLSRLALFDLNSFDPSRTTLLLPDLSFVVSSNRKSIEFRDVKTGKVARSWKIKTPMPAVTPMTNTVSPDSRFLDVGFDGKAAGVTRIYRISDAKFWEAPVGSAPFIGFSADSRLALFAEGSTFIARDINSGHKAWRMEVPDAQSFILAPDGHHLYNVDEQGVIRRWDVP